MASRTSRANPTSRLFSGYAEFCSRGWPARLGTKDLVVLALGLPGEWGEVAELLAEGVPRGDGPLRRLGEALGDVSCCWARLVRATGLDAGELAEAVLQAELDLPAASDGVGQVPVLALRMTAACARVADAIKRRVRDGKLDAVALRESLRRVVVLWNQLCCACGLEIEKVLGASQEKVRREVVRAKRAAARAERQAAQVDGPGE